MNKLISLFLFIVFLAVSISASFAQEIRVTPTTDICDIAAFDGGVSCVVSYNKGIYRTTDMGNSWTLVYTDADTSLNLISIAYQGKIGVAVGTKSINNFHRAVFIKTVDAGLTWQRLTVPQEFTHYPYAVAMKDKKIVVVKDLKTWISEDEGETWSFTSSSLSMGGNGHLQIAPNGMLIYSAAETRQSSDGINWNYMFQYSGENIRAISMVGNTLFGVGMGDNMRGVILRDWLKQDVAPIRLPYRSMLADIKFVNESTGYTCGARMSDSIAHSAALVYKTTNSGRSWFVIYEGQLQNNNSILFNIATSGTTVYCQGVDFIVPIDGLDSDNPSGQGSGLAYSPQKHSLSQNYPNPFNPTTKITFILQGQSFVRLSIFDAAGRIVRTIVEETRNVGTYTEQFDGSRLSSGIYFYKLETEGFTAIKKMMLVK